MPPFLHRPIVKSEQSVFPPLRP